MSIILPDTQEREQACDPTHSYVVQAPAGSGKTELLTQRFLTLLGRVNQPEAILALTFTRRAAHEMRSRILNSLQQCESGEEQDTALNPQTQNLAKRALANAKDWTLSSNPHRLQIQTIDAFCASLVQRMPIETQFGASAHTTDDATPYYRQAVANVLHAYHQDNPHYADVKLILSHLDHDYGRLERLLIRMLARREQWLPHIAGQQDTQTLRQHLENALLHIAEEAMEHIKASLPATIQETLPDIMRFVSETLDTFQIHHSITTLPAATLEHMSTWLDIADLCLTKTGQWRKQVTLKNGFPAPSSAPSSEDKLHYQTMKQRMLALLGELEAFPDFRHTLDALRHCPPLVYPEQQWELVGALLDILPKLAADLLLIFSEQGTVDYSEITTRALMALGDAEHPTDLSLRFDYRIEHILIDEFQDTSIPQYRLLQALTHAWQRGDGRTLFLVGDPMQSIYRFRAAEVGLFLRAQHEGINDIALKILKLQSNFRSNEALVDWFNETFSKLFPEQDNIARGAITYTAACALKKHTQDKPSVCSYQCTEKIIEAQKIITIIREHPNESIAILVKSRTHLQFILPALQNAHIDYQGIDLESLGHKPIVEDLWSLTQALLQIDNRLAYFNILRAPWCGLCLADLQALATLYPKGSLYPAFTQTSAFKTFTPDGWERFKKCAHIVKYAIDNRARQSLRNWVEQTWHHLKGPNCLQTETEHRQAETFLDLLEQHDIGGQLRDVTRFSEKLNRLYSSQVSTSHVSIMTIHKAKGLEFDVVILPSLEQASASGQSELLLWSQRPSEHGDNDLILAPMQASDHGEPDLLYNYLKKEDKQKEAYERLRLLYVASTRAKQHLYLLATHNEEESPHPRSFLAALLPVIQKDWILCSTPISIETESHHTKGIERLPSHHFEAIPDSPSKAFITSDIKMHWKPNSAQIIGVLLHRHLQYLGECGTNDITFYNFNKESKKWSTQLLHLGLLPHDLPQALDDVKRAWIHLRNDPKALWILNKQHQDAHCEYALTLDTKEICQHYIVDRTFIDDAGIRWIIDYKTSRAHDIPQAQFLQQEQASYREQLENYARIFKHMADHPIKLALYFPLLPAWVEWEYCEVENPVTY